MIDKIGVPAPDSAVNTHLRDVIGNKADTALQAASATDSMMRYIKGLILGQSRLLLCLDYWSVPVEEVAITQAAVTRALPAVVVSDLPAGMAVVHAYMMFKFRIVENTNAAVNSLDGATVAATSQVMQVDDSGATGYVDAINFVDDQFSLIEGPLRESGDVCIGSIDIAARVDGNDTYALRWLLGKANQDNLNFNDVQVGLRIWYSI